MKRAPLKSIATLSAITAVIAAACGGPETSTIGDEENLGEANQELVVTNCTQPMPSNGVPINFDRELVMRSVYVVEDGQTGDGNDEANDHCRTSWTVPCSAAKQGHWTFGYMMAAMAGTSDVTSLTAKNFVKNWLKLWLTPQQPNSGKTAAAPRTAITETLINPWLTESGCPAGATIETCALDLKKAPFRLLAFVNRADLPAIAGYSTGNGEFRAVFGALGYDPINCVGVCPTGDMVLPATVILEYNFPSNKTLQQWATDLHALSSFNPDDVTQTLNYRSKLQTITDAIVGPNSAPFAHNKNPISHVRTNENAFDCNMGTADCAGGLAPNPPDAQWEFRQFVLNGGDFTTGRNLIQDVVSQTPQTSDDKTLPLNTQFINRRTQILGGDPAFTNSDAAFLGNSSLSPSVSGAIVWEKSVLTAGNAPGMTAAERAQTRHQFGFGTCNGCHYAETRNDLLLFHVGPREAGVASGISSFLSVNGASDPLAANGANTAPTNTQQILDPAGTGVKFFYNEPWRRACEIRRILTGSTTPFTKPTGHLM